MIRAIKTEDQYSEALTRIEELWGADEGTEQFQEFEVLGILLEHYENEHYPVTVPDPIEYLQFALDQEMLTRKDLFDIFGSNSRISEALSGKRPLSKNQLVKICIRFQLPGETIIKYLIKTDPGIASMSA